MSVITSHLLSTNHHLTKSTAISKAFVMLHSYCIFIRTDYTARSYRSNSLYRETKSMPSTKANQE
jgi:hypothetical protein